MSNLNKSQNNKSSSSSIKDKPKEEKDTPKCEKCSQSKNIYQFSCSHSLCLECLYNYSISTNFEGMSTDSMLFSCPICHDGSASFDNDSWINALNELINDKNDKNKQLEVKENETKKKCAQHQNQPITSYCPYCKIWLCEECKKMFHNNYYPDHVLTTNEQIEIFCHSHSDTIMTFFCLKCQKLVCSQCLAKGNEHYLHRYVTKIENEQMNKDKNGISYKSYAEFEEVINRIESSFFGQIENDFILKKTKIEELIQSLQQLEEDYMNQMQTFQTDMMKIFQIIRLSFFNYIATDDKKRNKDITLANSLTNITLLSSKKVDINDMCREFAKQMSDFNTANANKKSTLSYELQWDNSKFEKETSLQQVNEDNNQETVAHSEGVTKIVELKKINSFATSSLDSSINIWSLDSPQFKYKLKDHKSSIWSLLEHSSGSLISGSSDKTIKVWMVTADEGFCANTLRGHKGTVYSLSELKDGTLLSGSEDGMIKLWNINTKSCLQSIDNGSAVNSMTTLVDDIVLTGGISNTIKLWDANELVCLGELKGHGCTVWCLAPFEDGVQIVSGSSDNSIKIWDLNEFKCTGTLEGHDNSISSLKIMKSKLLLSGSWDFTVKIWNLNTKLCVYTMKGHTGIVFDVIELSNGKIATASKDKSVIIWKKE